MSDDILELTPVQMDALREIGNVGAGNSATALSQIINHRIDMNVPQVSIVPLGDVPDLVGGPDVMVVGVFLRFTDRRRGIFCSFCRRKARSIWSICSWGRSMGRRIF